VLCGIIRLNVVIITLCFHVVRYEIKIRLNTVITTLCFNVTRFEINSTTCNRHNTERTWKVQDITKNKVVYSYLMGTKLTKFEQSEQA